MSKIAWRFALVLLVLGYVFCMTAIYILFGSSGCDRCVEWLRHVERKT